MISGCAKSTLALVALTSVGVFSVDARILRLRGHEAVGTSTSGKADLSASISSCSTAAGECDHRDAKIKGLACKQLKLCPSGVYEVSCGKAPPLRLVCLPVMESNEKCILFAGPRFSSTCTSDPEVQALLVAEDEMTPELEQLDPEDEEGDDLVGDDLDEVVLEQDPRPEEEPSALTLTPMWSAVDRTVVQAFLEQHYDRLTLLQRLMLENRLDQLTQQTAQCLSTCVLCVGKSSAEHDSLNVVQKSIHVGRARTSGATVGSTFTTLVGGGVGSWLGATVGSAVGIYDGLTNEDNEGALQKLYGGVKGAALGGVTGLVGGAVYGGAVAHSAHFTHCGAVEYTHSSAGREARGQKLVAIGGQKEVDKGITDTASSIACKRMELVDYSPKQLVRCMRHFTMCGNDGTTVALPVPVSNKEQCAALAHHDNLSLELLQMWSGEDLPVVKW